jgi:hypothetical protein
MSVSRRTWDFDDTLDGIAQSFVEKNRGLRARSGSAGVFAACEGCLYLEHGHCAGGCLAHLVKGAPGA